MSSTISNLFTVTGSINTIERNLREGTVLEGDPTRRQEGELVRLKGIRTELQGLMTEDENVEWKRGYRQITISEDERRRREKAMDMENVDRDSI